MIPENLKLREVIRLALENYDPQYVWDMIEKSQTNAYDRLLARKYFFELVEVITDEIMEFGEALGNPETIDNEILDNLFNNLDNEIQTIDNEFDVNKYLSSLDGNKEDLDIDDITEFGEIDDNGDSNETKGWHEGTGEEWKK